MDNLKTEIITPSGRRVKPFVTVSRGNNGLNIYRLFVDQTEIGWMKLSIEHDHIFIGKMNNWTSDAPLSKRYTNVGRALHEIAFRESFNYTKEGRVEFIAETGTYLFHMSCGFVPSILEKIDTEKKEKIESAIAFAKSERQKGRNAPFYKVALGSGPMLLPPETIVALKKSYFSPGVNSTDPTSTPSPVSPVISHRIYQKMEKLVSTGKLSRRDAEDLKSKLLDPSHSGDKETWALALSSQCLAAFQQGYLDGFALGTYFSQTQSPKLKPMLNQWGMYAFSRFLIGWQDCEASDESTLRFVLSDWGLKALEEGYIKPPHFRGKLPTHKEFTETLYSELKSKEIEPEALFSLDPIAKPQNTVRIALV